MRRQKIVVLANCQTGGLTACLDLLFPDADVSGLHWGLAQEALAACRGAIAGADVVITSAPEDFRTALLAGHEGRPPQVVQVPSLFFPGFHPDLTYAHAEGANVPAVGSSPYHSAIGVWCWREGVGIEETRRLFTADAMRQLGYDRFWSVAVAQARGHFSNSRVSFSDVFLPLQASGGRFMHTPNHPCISAIACLARGVARLIGVEAENLRLPLEDLVPDALAPHGYWPIYPGVAQSLGLPSSLLWAFGGVVYGLDDYLSNQFKSLDAASGPVTSRGADSPEFDRRMRQLVQR